MTEEHARAVFLLAGFEALGIWKLENQYWPDAYVDLKLNSPWWLVKTKWGMIRIGWRKRVISVDFGDVGRVPASGLTEDNVTKYDHVIHAWGYPKAVEYMANLRCRLEDIDREAQEKAEAVAVS